VTVEGLDVCIVHILLPLQCMTSLTCAQDTVNGEFLGTSLENLELSNDVSWEDLTEEQQRAFQKAAAEGRLSSLIEVLAVYFFWFFVNVCLCFQRLLRCAPCIFVCIL
jgi:hypothetical protein